MGVVLGVIGFGVFVLFALFQFHAAFVGITEWAGTFWAWVAMIAAFGLRFTLPITVGAFYGATAVWGWHWIVALLFVAPGLALLIPGALAGIFSLVRR